VLAACAAKFTAGRGGCAPRASKSTLNRLEHAPGEQPGRYHLELFPFGRAHGKSSRSLNYEHLYPIKRFRLIG